MQKFIEIQKESINKDINIYLEKLYLNSTHQL